MSTTHNHDDDTHRSIAKAQRAALELAANDIEAGRAPQDPSWIANVLREAARNIPLEQGGHAARFDQLSAMLLYGRFRVLEKLTHRAAVVKLTKHLTYKETATGDDIKVSKQAIEEFLTEEVRAEAIQSAERIPR